MQTEVTRAKVIGSTIKDKNPFPTRVPKKQRSSGKVTGKKGGGLPYSSEDRVTGHGKAKDVVEGVIVEDTPKALPSQPEEIWDAEEVRPALEAKKPYAMPMPRQLQGPHIYANKPETRITEIPTKSEPGKRTRISTARLAGNRLSWNDMQSGKYAGSMYSGSEINKASGIKVGQRPSTRAQKDPQYKAELLAKLENEVGRPSSGKKD